MTDIKVTQADREYRKIATIKARQWWRIGDHPAVKMRDDVTPETVNSGNAIAWIETLEGGHEVSAGDWIATGVKGEHWPIKPDIFEMSYREVIMPFSEAIDPNASHNRRHRIEAQRPLLDALERLMDSIMERTKGDYAGSWDNALAAIKQAKGE